MDIITAIKTAQAANRTKLDAAFLAKDTKGVKTFGTVDQYLTLALAKAEKAGA